MGTIGKFLPGVEHLHNLHPLTVHFPLSFLFGSALLYAVSWIHETDKSEWAAYWLLLFGFVTCTIAVGTGFYALWEVKLSDTVRQRLGTPHMYWMVTTWLITNALAAWAIMDKPFPRAGRWIFMLLFFIMLVLMTLGADYGSRMVYDYNANGNAVSSPVHYSK